MKKSFFCLFLFLVLFSGHAFAHANEEDYDFESAYPVSQGNAGWYGSLLFLAMIFAMIFFHKSMSEAAKKVFYVMLAGIVLAVTVYLIAATLHLNFTSMTKGPVHWHADFEVWVCGKEINPVDPIGLSNKIGIQLIHEHNDNRIHVEGVVTDKKQASLGYFFSSIGGSLSSDGLQIPTKDGLMSVHDGDLCNGQAGKLYVFVNGEQIQEPKDHVIAPHEKVPPGDRIKIEFTEKQIEEISPEIK